VYVDGVRGPQEDAAGAAAVQIRAVTETAGVFSSLSARDFAMNSAR